MVADQVKAFRVELMSLWRLSREDVGVPLYGLQGVMVWEL